MTPCPTSTRNDSTDVRVSAMDLEKAPSKRENPPRSQRTPLTTAQQGLATRYVPMARSMARPLKKSWPNEREEFESAALLALVEAAQSFDPVRNVKFATFARYRIWGALRDVQRGLITAGWRSDMENAPTLSSLKYDSEEHGRVLNSEPDRPVGQVFEAFDFVEGWLRKLPARQSATCLHIYINGRTQGEAADLIGCSKSRLSYLHKEALDIIKDGWDHADRAGTRSR